MKVFKKKFLPILLTIAILTSCMGITVFAESDLPFSDVSTSDWHYEYVKYAYENKLVQGDPGGTFRPNDALTRAEFTTILWRMAGTPDVGSSDFTDVSANKWYADAVAWAQTNGIVNGYPDGTFLPNKLIERQQATAILFRYAQNKGYINTDEFPDMVSTYEDAGDIADYAQDNMNWAVWVGLLQGNSDTELAPEGTTTRAQIATMLMRFCECIVPALKVTDHQISLSAYSGASINEIYDLLTLDSEVLIAPYVNDDGTLPRDGAILEAAGQAVYAWALQLQNAGIIDGCSYNSTGYSVGFFLKDDSTYVYFPSIEGTLSGSSNSCYNVSAFYGLNGLETFQYASGRIMFAGATASSAAEKVYDVPEYTSITKTLGASATVATVKTRLQALNEKHTRAIFWEGHGGIYTDEQGVERVSLILCEKRTAAKRMTYDYDISHDYVVNSGNYYALSSSFFETYLPQVDGGLFYCGSCYSNADGGIMANILFEKGFDAYCGATDSIDTLYSYQMMLTVSGLLATQEFSGEYPPISNVLESAETLRGDTDTGGTSVLLSENPETLSFRLVPSYREAYAKVLREYGSGKFDLIYVDEDDIPELVIAGGGNHVRNADLYTFYNGEAVYLGGYGAYGTLIYYPLQNYFGGEAVKYEIVGTTVRKTTKIASGLSKEAGYYSGKTINTTNINVMLNS